MEIYLPDNSKMEMEKGATVGDLALKISKGLYNHSLAGRVNGELKDLSYTLNNGDKVTIIKDDAPEAHDILLHSASHVMAQAVQDLYPEAKVTIGPAVENKFYYDFDKDPAFTEDDLEKIEARMEEIIEEDLEFERKEISRDEAIQLFKEKNEDYKVEIIQDLDQDEKLSLYQQGDFIDLCRGPHVPSTGKIKAFKLLNTAGAYWRGDSSNKMLSRIYGTAFPSKKELNKYLNFLEEAKKRDHRKIGKELDLFHIDQEVGPGLILWHPKGARILQQIKDYWIKAHIDEDYELVQSPHIGQSNLWKTSGHLDFYSEGMFNPMKIEDDAYYIKPMNCPFHIKIYNSDIRSYRDLPIKYAELGTVYRYEKSGVLHGLMRVRGFTQDDAHIICMPEQLDHEIQKLLEFTFDFLDSFGFSDIDVYISTRSEDKYVGSKEMWEEATNALKSSLDDLKIEYQIDEGEATFYGPKIDMKIRDSLNRDWQCTTIQFDFNLAERFNMEYVDSDGERKQPYMIHRAILGSLERFLGVLIEHTKGNFPVWLAPVQVAVLPISDTQIEEAQKVHKELQKHGIRSELNTTSEPVSAKIRKAETDKIPYMFIIGDREIENETVSVRKHMKGDIGTFKRSEIIDTILEEIANKNRSTKN
ncbi:MAG: threonine--tRNA ligase [Candidatus Marinimicrobia bacterium]|nr:threonine--tRNA ligase [Candidatus Neomarinimicrobiota bacterium]